MPVYKTKNERFFRKWTPEMAYILGFFTADGSMIKNKRGAHFIEFYTTEGNLLKKIKDLLGSNHKISVRKRSDRWQIAYRLQIGSKTMFNDLLKLGLVPHKSKRITFPYIPKKYFSHFVRGYFDGDGCVTFGAFPTRNRKSKAHILLTRFTSGNKKFLEKLLDALKIKLYLKGGSIASKKNGFDLSFSIKDSFKICKCMYTNIKSELFLKRKFDIFNKALNYWGRSSIG